MSTGNPVLHMWPNCWLDLGTSKAACGSTEAPGPTCCSGGWLRRDAQRRLGGLSVSQEGQWGNPWVSRNLEAERRCLKRGGEGGGKRSSCRYNRDPDKLSHSWADTQVGLLPRTHLLLWDPEQSLWSPWGSDVLTPRVSLPPICLSNSAPCPGANNICLYSLQAFLMAQQETPVQSLGQKGRRKWQPTPAFLPGKSHGQRSLVGYSPWGRKRVRHNF